MINIPIEALLNEDYTPFNPPENPLKEKWIKLYTPIKDGEQCSPYIKNEDGSDIPNYSCVLCTENCPHQPDFKIPEEDKEEYENYMNELREYNRIHNPKLFKLGYFKGRK